MSHAIICLASNTTQTASIVDALKAAGFSNNVVSLLIPESSTFRDLGYEKHSKAPEGVAIGASTGAILGGTFGWLVGVGSLTIPGVGPFIAAGPIMAALSGVAVGGTAGGATGGLIGLGIPEYEAKQYSGKLKENKILVSVHTENGDEARRAEHIFKACKAEEINRISEEAVSKAS